MLWFEYAVIKYTPDLKRGETVNIGLMVFLSESIDMRMLNSTAKVRMLDGQSAHSDVIAFEKALHALPMQSIEQEHRYDFISTLLDGSISLSPQGRFAIDLPNQYEAKITQLFDTLIKPYSLIEKQAPHSRLTTTLKNKFRTRHLLAKDPSELSYHKVVANYPINPKAGITADFLIKNGVYHISEVIDFNVNDTQAKFKETSLKTMTFLMAKKALGESSQCYFVYSASLQKENEIIQHLNMAEDYSDKIFNIASKEEMNHYLAMISALASPTEPVFH